MKRFIIAAFAIALAVAPAAAMADSFKVGNFTGSTLRFSIHCADGYDSWHTFSIASMASALVGGSEWNYNCSGGIYKLRIGTTTSDGSTSYQTVTLHSGYNYGLVQSSLQDAYVAYDTRWLVAIRNTTSVTVKVGYSCVSGPEATGTATIAPTSNSQPPSWFYSKGCSRFSVATNARLRDGSNSIWRSEIASNGNYRLVWSASRSQYILERYYQ